ncbi:MAG: hypothetical protein AAGK17_08505 [Pseudomonadota bacterium]
MPISVDPARSLVALSGLIVPLTIISVGWSIAYQKLFLAGWWIAGLGIISVIIGIPHVLNDGAAFLLYPETPMPGVLSGTFANRNSAGIFLVCALCFVALLPSPVTRHDVLITRI